MSNTKRFLSIILCLAMICSALVPTTAFAAEEGDYPLEIFESGVLVSENGDNPLRIKENQQKQLTVKYLGSETLPEGTKVVWSSPTPYLVYVDENGVITGRDSSKGAILRIWVDTNIASLWLIGPSLADTIYDWFDDNDIDAMDTEAIVNVVETGLTVYFGEETAKNMADSLRETLDRINVEIRAALVNEETGEEIAYNSTHVVCDKSDSLTADFIPNGTYITNHEAVPAVVEVGYSVDLEGITTPLRLKMGVNWKTTQKSIFGDVATDIATVDENGYVVFNKPGTVKITATPDSEGLYTKIQDLIDKAGGVAKAGEVISWMLEEVFGMSVAPGIIDALVTVINGIVAANGSDEAEALKQVISTISDWILSHTINDSITVEVVEQIDVTSFEIVGDTERLNSWGGVRQLSIINVQPEGAVVGPNDIAWDSTNKDFAVVDSNGVLTIRGSDKWTVAEVSDPFYITATIDGVTVQKKATTMGGNREYPNDLEVNGPTQLEKGNTYEYSYGIYPVVLHNSVFVDYNDIDLGLMIDGKVVYEDNITDGVLKIEKSRIDTADGGKGTFTIEAVGGGESTLYVRAHSDSQSGAGWIEWGGKILREVKVSVYEPVSGISIDQGDAVTVEVETNLGYGKGSTQLTATISPATATNKGVVWSSDNRNVKVDENGLVSYQGSFVINPTVSATITAASAENGEILDTCVVTFIKAPVHVSGVSLDRTDITVYEGKTDKLTATIAPDDANDKSVTWSSDNESVVTVAEDGTVTAVAVGDATVTVTTVDGGYTASCTVKVRADKEALVDLIEKTEPYVEYVQAERDAAIAVADKELATQAEVDAAYDALYNAFITNVDFEPLKEVAITHDGAVIDGSVVYVKIPWNLSYKKASTELGIAYTEGAEIKSVKWELAKWSVDDPEGTVTGDGETAVVAPNGRGIGARSIWVTVTVEDIYGNIATDTVKVRFIKWDWQRR